MQTNMEKDTVTGEYDLLEKLQVKQERVYGWTCACVRTAEKGQPQREKGKRRDKSNARLDYLWVALPATLSASLATYSTKETKLVCFILVLILVPSYLIPIYINIFHVINVKFPSIIGEI